MNLRPYQHDLVERLETCRRPLMVLPTGGGKTHVAAEVIRQAANSHVLFIAHRRELITHARDKLISAGVWPGVILAGHPASPMARVQVASVQTLWARYFRRERELPPAKIVFIDEAHHAPARTYRAIVERFPEAKIVGMTATPCRRDGRGLGSIFTDLIEGPSVQELIDLDYLVKTKVFAPSKPDLKGVHTRRGDYVETELAERMDRPELVGDIVSTWHRLVAERRKTVIFATSVAHSIHLRDEFLKSGVRAEHLDGKTPKDQRDDILHRLATGALELVTNCMVLCEGFDLPDIGCIVLARPTKSMGLFRQMVGRGLRPADGKTDCLVLDHAGAVFAHGFVEDRVAWSLDPDEKADNPAHAARDLEPSSRLLECAQCKAIRTAGEACRNCGFKPEGRPEFLPTRDGDLERIDRKGRRVANDYSDDEKHRFHAQLAWIARERGYKPGWAAYRFKAKFGHWPYQRDVMPEKPGPEVASWERHQRIKYAKAMQKAAANGR